MAPSKKDKKKGYVYKGSGKDPAVNLIRKQLDKDPSSLDTSGMGTHWQVKKKVNEKEFKKHWA